MDFEKFGSLTRFSQGWTITEKIDGSNGQIAITPCNGRAAWGDQKNDYAILDRVDDHFIYAGSRNRWLTPNKQQDNMGFARWVLENAQELVSKLGVGRHYGEWYGSGIQRTYGLSGGDKRFALFNAPRWENNPDKPECCEVVKSFVLDEYLDDPYLEAGSIMERLKKEGSLQVPGFDNPEGIVMFHRKSGTAFKKTFDYDEFGKWKENRKTS